MKQNIDKGTLFMAVLISIVVVILADLFILSFSVYFPLNNSMDDVTGALSKPMEVYNASKNTDLFLPLQLGAIAGAIFLSFKFYKLILGEGKYKDASNYGAHGTSRFAKETEVFNDKEFVKKTFNKSAQKNLENKEGLIFGLLNNKPVILPDETKIPNRNISIVGSPGSGKTQSFLLTNLIFERNRSIVITDPKGEIFESTAKLKQQQGYEVRLVNFKEMLISERYNPIDYITKEVEAEQVANTIVINSMQGQKPDFWTKAEIALLKTLLLYVKYEEPANANLSTVKRILTIYGSTPEDMDLFFSHLEPDHPAFSAYQIVRMANDKVRDSIFVSLAITLSKFDATDVRKFTETSDFLLDDIGKKKMAIYVILPVADSTWEPLIANFFTQMFQRLYDVADKNFNKLPVPVNLFLDEFPNLGKIPNYEEILATCRSYGISCATIIQSIGQLIDKYNKEKTEAIIGNCSLRYLLGVGDKLTAEYFSELIGKTTIRTQSSSVSKNEKGGSDSKSNSYTGRSLLTPDELSRMPREQAVLLVTGGYPIKLKKTFQFEFFKGILNDENKVSRFDYFDLKKSPDENNNGIEDNLESLLTIEDFIDTKETITEKETNNLVSVKDSIITNMNSTSQMLENLDKEVSKSDMFLEKTIEPEPDFDFFNENEDAELKLNIDPQPEQQPQPDLDFFNENEDAELKLNIDPQLEQQPQPDLDFFNENEDAELKLNIEPEPEQQPQSDLDFFNENEDTELKLNIDPQPEQQPDYALNLER